MQLWHWFAFSLLVHVVATSLGFGVAPMQTDVSAAPKRSLIHIEIARPSAPAIRKDRAPTEASPAMAPPMPVEMPPPGPSPAPDPPPRPAVAARSAPPKAHAAAAEAPPPDLAETVLPAVSARAAPDAAEAEPLPMTTDAISDADAAAVVASYIAGVRQRVAAQRQYPSMARRRSIEGTVLVRIDIDSGGHVQHVDIADGASVVLARATRQAVDRAAPFPSPPQGAIGIEIPVRYELD